MQIYAVFVCMYVCLYIYIYTHAHQYIHHAIKHVFLYLTTHAHIMTMRVYGAITVYMSYGTSLSVFMYYIYAHTGQ